MSASVEVTTRYATAVDDLQAAWAKTRAVPGSIHVRFWEKVAARPTGCWQWTGALSTAGYGKISAGGHKGATLAAHRWLYEVVNGPIPRTLDLDHLCRNRACVNPAHLEPVTRQVNLARGINANREKTSCRRGHPLSGKNLGINPNGRYCLTCKNEALRARREAARCVHLEGMVARP